MNIYFKIHINKEGKINFTKYITIYSYIVNQFLHTTTLQTSLYSHIIFGYSNNMTKRNTFLFNYNLYLKSFYVHEMENELANRRWFLYNLQHIFWVILACVLLSLQAFQLITIEAAVQKLCSFCFLSFSPQSRFLCTFPSTVGAK